MKSQERNDNGEVGNTPNKGIGTPVSRHCVVLGVAPSFRCRFSRLECLGYSWFLDNVVRDEWERWKDRKRGIHWGCWIGVARVIASFSADMVCGARPAERRSWWKMGAAQGIVDGGVVRREWQ